MKQILSTLILLTAFFIATAQNAEKIEKLIQEGIALHDKGEYTEAIKKYNAALDLDKNDFAAAYEKSFSLTALGKLKEANAISKELLQKFGDHPNIKVVYIQYGSTLDDLGKTKDALEVYNEGIKKFPDEYLLHFNKGLTLQKMENYSEALLSYENSLKLKPLHASSNLYTGMIIQKQNRIPAFLAYATFIGIEPNTKRSKEGFDRINQILGSNVKRDGNNTTIFLDPSMLGGKNKRAENDFGSLEMMFSLLSANDNSKGMDSLGKTPADKLNYKMQMLINMLSLHKKDGKGFYWEHYAPFFVAMKDKTMLPHWHT